ncbi:ninjurin-2-like isoform X3 [Amblyomma americanum]
MDSQPIVSVSSASEDQADTPNGIVTDADDGADVDANVYATKKTVAEGFLDVALLTLNSAQLKHTLEQGNRHPFYTLVVALASISIALQVVVGVLLIILGCLDLRKPCHRRPADILNNVATSLVLAVTIISIFSTSFDLSHHDDEHSVPDHFPTVGGRQEYTTYAV